MLERASLGPVRTGKREVLVRPCVQAAPAPAAGPAPTLATDTRRPVTGDRAARYDEFRRCMARRSCEMGEAAEQVHAARRFPVLSVT
jgi:hypothetical protein